MEPSALPTELRRLEKPTLTCTFGQSNRRSDNSIAVCSDRSHRERAGVSGIETRNRAICAAWLEWLGKRNKPLTCYQYAQRLEQFCSHIGSRPLADLCLSDLEAWVDRPRRSGQGGADATKNREVIILRGLYSYANSHSLMSQNPAMDLVAPTVRNSNPRAIPDDLWSKVWRSELDDEMRVVLGLGFFCGLRREEICRLKAEHFVADRIMHFPRKGDRNDKNTGVIPFVSCARLHAEKRPDLLAMPEDFLGPLSALLSLANPWVVPWGATAQASRRRRPGHVGPPAGMTNPDQVNRRLGILLVSRGLPRSAFTPHALRHSFVTNMLSLGVPLQDVSVLANHSSLSITQRYIKTAADPLARFLGQPLSVSRWSDA